MAHVQVTTPATLAYESQPAAPTRGLWTSALGTSFLLALFVVLVPASADRGVEYLLRSLPLWFALFFYFTWLPCATVLLPRALVRGAQAAQRGNVVLTLTMLIAALAFGLLPIPLLVDQMTDLRRDWRSWPGAASELLLSTAWFLAAAVVVWHSIRSLLYNETASPHDQAAADAFCDQSARCAGWAGVASFAWFRILPVARDVMKANGIAAFRWRNHDFDVLLILVAACLLISAIRARLTDKPIPVSGDPPLPRVKRLMIWIVAGAALAATFEFFWLRHVYGA